MAKTDQSKIQAREKAAAERETALRGKPLTSIPTEGSSLPPRGSARQQTLAARKSSAQEKKKGKMPASSTAHAEDDESDEEIAPLKRARRSTDEEGRPYANRDRTVKPPLDIFVDYLKKGVTWTPTRFGDVDLMVEIGIDEDVKTMLGNMNLSNFYAVAHPTYKDLCCEFLASLVVTYHNAHHPRQGWGKITFRTKGRTTNIGFKEIGRIYGFKDASDFHLPKIKGLTRENNIPTKVWKLISGLSHSSGSDKSSAIRNPAVRYLHRMLVHAFYPRKEPGNVTEDDMRLLCLALQPFAPEELPFDVSEIYKDFGMVGFFVARLEYYRDWAWPTGDQEPQIGIGGMITPLLQWVHEDMGCEETGPTFLDGTHMKVAQYFGGRYFGSCVYTYKKPGRVVELILPNKSLTSLQVPGAISFDIGDEHFLGPHGKLGAMATSKARKSYSAAQYAQMEQEQMPEDTSQAPYGPARYHFQPYAGALAPGPLKEAHDHINKLQRWNKHQDRTILKLRNKCVELSKAMKKQAKASAKFMKKVSEILTKGAIGGCSAADFDLGETSAPQPRPRADPMALGLPLSDRQRQRRNRNPHISPSHSGNKSPSLVGSDEDVGIEEVSTDPQFQDYTSATGGYYTYFPPDDNEYGASYYPRSP